MTVVKNLCTARGVTIVATIHSPTAYAFGLFDHLSMLVRGRTVSLGRWRQPCVSIVSGTHALVSRMLCPAAVVIPYE